MIMYLKLKDIFISASAMDVMFIKDILLHLYQVLQSHRQVGNIECEYIYFDIFTNIST